MRSLQKIESSSSVIRRPVAFAIKVFSLDIADIADENKTALSFTEKELIKRLRRKAGEEYVNKCVLLALEEEETLTQAFKKVIGGEYGR